MTQFKQRLLLSILALIPSAALAHPNHGGEVYSLAHYFTGSHLALLGASLIVLCVGYRLLKKYLSE